MSKLGPFIDGKLQLMKRNNKMCNATKCKIIKSTRLMYLLHVSSYQEKNREVEMDFVFTRHKHNYYNQACDLTGSR